MFRGVHGLGFRKECLRRGSGHEAFAAADAAATTTTISAIITANTNCSIDNDGYHGHQGLNPRFETDANN